MFRDLARYETLKPTGLPWAADVPAHWSVDRAKTVMSALDQRSRSGDEELLTVSSGRGVIPRTTASVTMFKADSYVGHKLCWPGDLVINSLWAWGRGLGVTRHHGIVSTAYGVYRLRSGGRLLPNYLHQLVRSEPFQWELQVRSQGVWKSRLQMTDARWLDAPLLLPPSQEQAAIVKYLAHANVRIDKAVTAKLRLVALLEEQERADREALLRGAHHGERVPTEVPWIPETPIGWEVIRVKRVLGGIEQGWSPQCDAQPAAADEWGVTKAGCTNHARFREEDNKRLPLALDPRPELEIRHGDLLVSRANTRDLVGSAAVALLPRSKLMFSDKTFRLRTRHNEVDNEFLALAMSVRSARDQIEARAVGASHSMQNIGQGVIANLWIALPPLAEQREIAAWIRGQSVDHSLTIEKIEREIALLQEFRTRLLADVVTGQVDVRAVAATLPDVPESVAEPVADASDDLADAPAEADG